MQERDGPAPGLLVQLRRTSVSRLQHRLSRHNNGSPRAKLARQLAVRSTGAQHSHLARHLLSGMRMMRSQDGFRCLRQGICMLLTFGMLSWMLGGCGYTLVGAPSGTPGDRLPLNIAPFINQTREPDLERITTAALRHAIVQSQMFVFTGADTSVTRLQGAIRRFISYPLALDAQDNVVEYRIDAAIYIRLIEADTQRPLLEQEIASSAMYLVSRSTTDRVRQDVAAREAAIVRLAQQFADKCLALLAVTLL